MNQRIKLLKRAIAGSTTLTAAMLAALGGAAAQSPACPAEVASHQLIFSDGAIAMRTPLAVNPDGAAASYAPGDHGYTYILNGVNLIDHGAKVGCSAAANQARCRNDWAAVEAGAFAAGTPEFCVFAMEVEPLKPGAMPVRCELPKKGRYVVGNGLGRPKLGMTVKNVSGDQVTTYLSTTTLRHTVGGHIAYVDSAAVPAIVAPTTRPELVGAVAWVRYGGRQVYAIVNDTGPRFGEGSVALHQYLRSGQVGPLQPIGPIPPALRCSPVETGLRPPFVSRPSTAGQVCGRGAKPEGAADIRAYGGLGNGVESVILPRVRPPMKHGVVSQELTPQSLTDLAVKAGYTPERLSRLADCLRR